MTRFLRYFDVYDKYEDEYKVNFKLDTGISLAIAIVCSFIFCFNTILFLSPEYTRDLSIDEGNSFVSETVNISLTVEVGLPCFYLHVDALDSTGNEQLNIRNTVTLRRLAANGTLLGNSSASMQDICYSCYGILPESECCNSCEELILLAILNGMTPDTKEWEQCKNKNTNISNNERCLIKGKITVPKTSGSFHIAPGSNVKSESYHLHNLLPSPPHNNLSHKIDRIRFGPYIPRSSAPLYNIRRVQFFDANMRYNYNMQVTPLIYKVDGKVKTNGYEYIAMSTSYGVSMLGTTMPGLYFTYTFSPYTVVVNQHKHSIIQFTTSTCGTIAGLFAIAALCENLLFDPQGYNTPE